MLIFDLNPWPLFLCAALAGAATWYTYRRSTPRPTGAPLAALWSLRFTALLILLTLLFKPVWESRTVDERAPVLAVLLDDSESVAAEDAAQAVRRIAGDLPEIDGETHLYAFASEARGLPHADSLRFDGPRTDMAGALVDIRESLEDDNLRGVLLVSDGQFNAGRNPVYTAERYGVPIHALAVGDTLRRRDLQVRRVTANEIAYLGQPSPVQVGLRAEGAEEERVTVTLLRGAEVLAAQSVQLPEGSAELSVDLEYSPAEEGLQQLTVTVTHLLGEFTHRNNSETLTVRVLTNRRRILLLAAAPDPDVAAVTEILRAEGETEMSSHVQKGPGAFYGGPPPASLNEYDLIVLFAFPGPGTDPTLLDGVADAARSGVPLLYMAGRYADINAVQTLGPLMPAQPTRHRPGADEASFLLTAAGRQHPILEVSQPVQTLDRLPPLRYHRSPWEVSPDARVLARVTMRGVKLSDPLLVVRNRGGSRSAALLGSGVWRWHNLPEDLEEFATFFPTLLGNLVQWLTTPEDDRPVRVRPVEEAFGGGESIAFTGQVYDESLNPVGDASVSVVVTAPDGERYPHAMEAVESGRYVLEIGTLPEGSFEYEVEATREGKVLGTDTGAFTVGALTLEFKETTANASLMRQIARRSGGRFFTPASLGELPGTLAADSLFRPVVRERSSLTNLWQYPLCLAVVLLLLTAEWVYRKRRGLV